MKKTWLLSLSLATLTVIAACGDNNETNEGNNEGMNNGGLNNQEEEPEGNNEAALEGGETAEQPEMPEPDLEGVPDVVAEVNGEEIPKDEFEATYTGQFEQATMQSQMTGEEVNQDELKQLVADNMVSTELLVQEANNQGYDASEEEINETLDEIAVQNGLESADEFMAALQEQGMDEEEIMSQVELQVKVDQLIASESGDMEPTEEELEQAYEQMEQQQEQMGGDEEMPSFDEIRPELEQQVRQQKEGEASQMLIDDLREDADVTIHL
nr:SurA N-terminal domain-containing protein [Salipaludibacillus daqingensis]